MFEFVHKSVGANVFEPHVIYLKCAYAGKYLVLCITPQGI